MELTARKMQKRNPTDRNEVRRGKGEAEMKKRKVFALLWAFGLLAGASGMTAFAAEQNVEEAAAQEASLTEPDVKAAAQEASSEEPYVSRIVSFTDCTGMHVTYDANASREYIYEVEDGVLTGVKVKKADDTGAVTEQTHKFEGTVELQQPVEGEKYTSIAADLFGSNKQITYVKLPAGVTVVTAESFRGCTALKSVYLPSTVKTIEKEAFRDCTAMTQIAVPKSVTAIGAGAFQGDTKLQMIYFRGEKGPESIGENAIPGAEEAEELVIAAQKGSSAEAYAEENGLPFEENEPEE